MTENTMTTTEPVPAPAKAEAPATREERRYLAPPVDIYETDGGLCVMVDLPGVEPQGIEIQVDNGHLTIVGHVTPQAGLEPVYREFELNDYFRQFRLNEAVDQEKINAELKQGVLQVLLPRRDAVQPRQIEVKVS